MKIEDSFVEENLFNDLSSYLFATSTPWYKKIGTTVVDEPELLWFSHCFYNNGAPDCEAYELIVPILQKLGCRAPMRVQANLVLKTPEPFRTHWHTDFEYKDSHTSILYMNKCNGATVFKLNDEKVMSEANRMVTFNALKEHATLTQTDVEERIVVNLNYF